MTLRVLLDFAAGGREEGEERGRKAGTRAHSSVSLCLKGLRTLTIAYPADWLQPGGPSDRIWTKNSLRLFPASDKLPQRPSPVGSVWGWAAFLCLCSKGFLQGDSGRATGSSGCRLHPCPDSLVVPQQFTGEEQPGLKVTGIVPSLEFLVSVDSRTFF